MKKLYQVLVVETGPVELLKDLNGLAKQRHAPFAFYPVNGYGQLIATLTEQDVFAVILHQGTLDEREEVRIINYDWKSAAAPRFIIASSQLGDIQKAVDLRLKCHAFTALSTSGNAPALLLNLANLLRRQRQAEKVFRLQMRLKRSPRLLLLLLLAAVFGLSTAWTGDTIYLIPAALLLVAIPLLQLRPVRT